MTPYEIYDLSLSLGQTCGILLGFFLTLHQLVLMRRDIHNTIQLAAYQNAMHLIERYAEPVFFAHRQKLHADINCQANLMHCAHLLNFFEEIAIAVKHKTANETLLEDFFGTILRMYMEKPYIAEAIRKARIEDGAIFQNLTELYHKWQRARDEQLRIDNIPALRT